MRPQRRRSSTKTPVRAALRPESTLVPLVKAGLGAVANDHRDYIEQSLRAEFADSIDIDEAFRVGHEQENRWDYVLGHTPTAKVIALEPHSAKHDEISTVIRKRRDALRQLGPHLRPGARISAWLWVASGRDHFADTEKVRRRLDQNGIEFIGARVLLKHMQGLA